MIVKLGAALSVQVQYIQLRGTTYQFRIRVPQHLVHHYGKPDIRKSLGTSDLKTASRLAEQEARKYLAEFQLLTEGKPITPQDVATAGRMLAEQYDQNFEAFLDHVIEPAREKYAAGDEDDYQDAQPSDYLKPEQLQAWQILANPTAFRLSDALKLYFKNHQRGSDEAFIAKVTHWAADPTDYDRLARPKSVAITTSSPPAPASPHPPYRITANALPPS